VCVEEHQCRSVRSKACRDCRKEARKLRRRSKKASDLLTDSGGAPLRRDSVRLRLEKAQLESLDANRRLRKSRAGVLKAQRQAEWAAEEEGAEASEIEDARLALKRKQEEMQEWQVRNVERLRKRQEEAIIHQTALRKTRRQLRKAKNRLHKVRRYYNRSKNRERWGRLLVAAEGFVHKLQKQEAEQRLAAADAQEAVNKQERDSQWVQRGLSRELAKAEQSVEKAKESGRSAHTRERFSREALQEAKRAYQAEAGGSERHSGTVKSLQKELRDNPLPTFGPQALNGSIPGAEP